MSRDIIGEVLAKQTRQALGLDKPKPKLPAHLGELFRDARVAMGFSLVQVARRWRTDPVTLSEYERGVQHVPERFLILLDDWLQALAKKLPAATVPKGRRRAR